MDQEELVKLAVAPNQTVAVMWAEALISEGIPAVVRCLDALAVTASILSPLPCWVLVRRGDVDKAIILLTQLTSGGTEDDRSQK